MGADGEGTIWNLQLGNRLAQLAVDAGLRG
jgi:hypothetical protein